MENTKTELKSAIEALIFAADPPITLKQICRVVPDLDKKEADRLVRELMADYNSRESGLQLIELADGFRIATRPETHGPVRRLLKLEESRRLTRASLEVLAIIAHRQPVTTPEISHIRGVASDAPIKTLVERRLIRPLGRKEVVGRPILYGTTREFLIRFGLKNIEDLPSAEELSEIVS